MRCRWVAPPALNPAGEMPLPITSRSSKRSLSKCLKDERLGDVKFFLCSWGYCTKQELALAEKEPRVEVIDLEGFGRIVKG